MRPREICDRIARALLQRQAFWRQAFWRQAGGSIAVLCALALIAIVACAGGAVDFGHDVA